MPHLVCMGEAHGSATGPAWRALGSNAEVHVALHMAATAAGSVSGTLSHQSQAQPAGGVAMPRFVKLSAVPRVPYSFLLITAHQGQWPQAAPRSGSADLPLSDGTQQCAQSLRHLLISCPDACDALIQLVETHDNPDNMEAAVVMPAGHPQGTQATKHGLSMSTTTSSEPCRCSASRLHSSPLQLCTMYFAVRRRLLLADEPCAGGCRRRQAYLQHRPGVLPARRRQQGQQRQPNTVCACWGVSPPQLQEVRQYLGWHHHRNGGAGAADRQRGLRVSGHFALQAALPWAQRQRQQRQPDIHHFGTGECASGL